MSRLHATRGDDLTPAAVETPALRLVFRLSSLPIALAGPL
jgi:hypothetical protein